MRHHSGKLSFAAMMVFTCISGTAFGFGYPSTTPIWRIPEAQWSGGQLHVLIHYSEETFIRSLGDIIFHEWGRPFSERHVFGVVSLPLADHRTRRRHDVRIYAHQKARNAKWCGFSGADVLFLFSWEHGWDVEAPGAAGRVRDVDIGGKVPLHYLYPADGVPLFAQDRDLFVYSASRGDWTRVGTLPSTHVEFNSRSGIEPDVDTRGLLCRETNLLCAWGAREAAETVVTGYALDDGTVRWRTTQPKEFSPVGIVEFEGETILAFAESRGRLRLTAANGRELFDTVPPEGFCLAPRYTPNMYTVVTSFSDAGRAGFVLVDIRYINRRRAILYVWEVDIHGSSRNWEVPITLRRPGRNTPLIDLSQ